MKDRYGNSYILKLPNYPELLRETTYRVMVKDPDLYNCGGFALGIFNWYRPYTWNENTEETNDETIYDIREDINYGADYDECCTKIAHIMIKTMEKEGLCRCIENSSELKKGEYLVAFKASYDDFHYVRRLSNGRWFHKMGCSNIEEISKDEVYSYKWWHDLYCNYAGDLFLLAVPYSNSDRALI